MVIWDVILLVIAIFLILFVVIQGSKDDIQQAFSGEKSELFKHQKQRGFELFLSRSTLVLSVLFMVIAFVASFLVDRWIS